MRRVCWLAESLAILTLAGCGLGQRSPGQTAFETPSPMQWDTRQAPAVDATRIAVLRTNATIRAELSVGPCPTVLFLSWPHQESQLDGADGRGFPIPQVAILARAADGWREIPLPCFAGYGWQGVFSADGQNIWAVLDNEVESPGWNLLVIRSTDGGLTWRRISDVHKPSYLGWFDDLAVGPDGRARLTVRLVDDYTDTIKAGLYHYRTTDAGATWSPPEYEAAAARAQPDDWRRIEAAR